MKRTIVSVTAGKKEDTLLYKSVTKNCIECNLLFVENNDESLTKCYNSLIETSTDSDVVIMCHDDVTLKTDPFPIIESYLDKYDIIGVAGAVECNLKCLALWHLMGGEGNLRGLVEHGTEESHVSTYFGPVPSRTVNADGVFLAIGRKIIDSDHRFDEKIPSRFHFYDIDFTLSAHLKGYRVGVANIPLIHASGGLKHPTDEFREGETYFLRKFKD